MFHWLSSVNDLKQTLSSYFVSNTLYFASLVYILQPEFGPNKNLKVVNFLDVPLDLNTSLYKPFMKSNDNPMNVNISSNHPTPILKNIPLAVNRRLSKISANETVFNPIPVGGGLISPPF